MYFLLKMGICHCYVSLPEDNSLPSLKLTFEINPSKSAEIAYTLWPPLWVELLKGVNFFRVCSFCLGPTWSNVMVEFGLCFGSSKVPTLIIVKQNIKSMGIPLRKDI